MLVLGSIPPKQPILGRLLGLTDFCPAILWVLPSGRADRLDPGPVHRALVRLRLPADQPGGGQAPGGSRWKGHPDRPAQLGRAREVGPGGQLCILSTCACAAQVAVAQDLRQFFFGGAPKFVAHVSPGLFAGKLRMNFAPLSEHETWPPPDFKQLERPPVPVEPRAVEKTTPA